MPKEKSLSDKISALLTAAPQNNSDDEDETRARIDDNFSDEDNDLNTCSSIIRNRNVNLLEELDERYAGRVCRREDVQSTDDEDDEDVINGNVLLEENNNEANDESDLDASIASNSDDDESAEELGSDEDNDSEHENDCDEDNDGEHENDSDEDNDSEHENDSDGEENRDSDSENDIENGDNFQSLATTSSQTKKGQSVRNQLQHWETLLEMRIGLQKLLVPANKLPLPHLAKEFMQDKEYSKSIGSITKTVENTLGKLLTMQKLLFNGFSETKSLSKGKGKIEDKPKEESDEEIPSDTENEEESESEEDENIEKPAKRRKLNDFEKDINEVYKKYTPYRNNVINHWNERTRLDTKNLSGTLNQINHILNDKSRLIRRSQLKKSRYEIIGEEKDGAIENGDSNNIAKRFVEEHNTEIYDDDDFYHQLLRELIECKSADITDPVQLGQQWVKLQSLRSKMKRKVDTKCTKGRKIRYTVHNKLVNLMAPVDPAGGYEQSTLYESIFK